MRGQRVFEELIRRKGLNSPIGKGRNNKLVYRRNECLIARYFFYGYFRNMCYEEIIRQLVCEFYLSPSTIAALIQQNTEMLQTTKEKAKALYFFQYHWPHLKW